MRPIAFKINIPCPAFSKHDNPKEVAKVLEDQVKRLFNFMDTFTEGMPFEYQNITVEPVFPKTERMKPSSTKKKV